MFNTQPQTKFLRSGSNQRAHHAASDAGGLPGRPVATSTHPGPSGAGVGFIPFAPAARDRNYIARADRSKPTEDVVRRQALTMLDEGMAPEAVATALRVSVEDVLRWSAVGGAR